MDRKGPLRTFTITTGIEALLINLCKIYLLQGVNFRVILEQWSIEKWFLPVKQKPPDVGASMFPTAIYKLWRGWVSNPQPWAYESPAPPLSYLAI